MVTSPPCLATSIPSQRRASDSRSANSPGPDGGSYWLRARTRRYGVPALEARLRLRQLLAERAGRVDSAWRRVTGDRERRPWAMRRDGIRGTRLLARGNHAAGRAAEGGNAAVQVH